MSQLKPQPHFSLMLIVGLIVNALSFNGAQAVKESAQYEVAKILTQSYRQLLMRPMTEKASLLPKNETGQKRGTVQPDHRGTVVEGGKSVKQIVEAIVLSPESDATRITLRMVTEQNGAAPGMDQCTLWKRPSPASTALC